MLPLSKIILLFGIGSYCSCTANFSGIVLCVCMYVCMYVCICGKGGGECVDSCMCLHSIVAWISYCTYSTFS